MSDDEGRKLAAGTAAGAGVGVAAAAAAVPIVNAAGFGVGGIVSGSWAASMMSAAAAANGGSVAAGSAVAILQSIGAAGLTVAGGAALVTGGAAVGLGVVGAMSLYNRLSKPTTTEHEDQLGHNDQSEHEDQSVREDQSESQGQWVAVILRSDDTANKVFFDRECDAVAHVRLAPRAGMVMSPNGEITAQEGSKEGLELLKQLAPVVVGPWTVAILRPDDTVDKQFHDSESDAVAHVRLATRAGVVLSPSRKIIAQEGNHEELSLLLGHLAQAVQGQWVAAELRPNDTVEKRFYDQECVAIAHVRLASCAGIVLSPNGAIAAQDGNEEELARLRKQLGL